MPATCPAYKKNGHLCGNPAKLGKYCGVHKDQYYQLAYNNKSKELSSQTKSLHKIARSVKINSQRITKNEQKSTIKWTNLSTKVKSIQKDQKDTNTTLHHVQTGLAALAIEQQRQSSMIDSGMSTLNKIERRMIKDKPTREVYLNKRMDLLHDANSKKRENNLALIRGVV